jgi:DNA-binding beta-propeller fold protein YncE
MTRVKLLWAAPAVVALGITASAWQAGQSPAGQTPPAAAAVAPTPPTNDAPNPYTTVEGYFKMPEGREWGSTSAVDIDRDGKSIWVAERCSANACYDAATNTMSPLDPVLLFDASGKLVRSFGKGMFGSPHGIHVDRDGNVWVTDWQDNFPRRARGAAADTPLPAALPPVGHQVYKFSPQGKLLLTLGKPGGNRPGQPADPASFYQPNDVITNDRGEIYVSEGHSSGANTVSRIVKFDRTGKMIKEWGKHGSGPGEFNNPHAFAWDSKGRLFVADRGNNRIQIFDQDGNLLDHGWEQYSRISGLFIDRNDMLYAADSESGSVAPARKDWKRGIRIGSVKEGKNGKILFFIPDPSTATSGTLAAEGVAVDPAGNVYGAEVGPRALKRATRRGPCPARRAPRGR